MPPSARLPDISRDNHLLLRRVERQQQLIELLHGRARRTTLAEIARELGVSTRTAARDVERLRLSGLPLDVAAGRGGGVSLRWHHGVEPIDFDLPEIAALLSSLATLGPTATGSAASAMHKLIGVLR